MKDIFAKCGFNCGRCPAYRENVKTDEDRQRGSDGWKKYFGFQIRYDRMTCDGCFTPDEEKPVMFLPKCPVRNCAFLNSALTCAHCSGFHTCMRDEKIYNPDVNREKIEARIGASIPEDDYLAFIEPFEHLRHLDAIRASLHAKDIVEPQILYDKIRIVDFPDDQSFAEEVTTALKTLYRLLVNIASIGGDTYARKKILEKRRLYYLKLLWAFGRHGKFEEGKSLSLIMDSVTYSDQKFTGHLTKLELYFEKLKEYGIHCEYIPLPDEKQDKRGWITPMGWLRKRGWFLKITFDESTGGASTIQALRNYTQKLRERYGNKAFRHFKNVDMRVLI